MRNFSVLGWDGYLAGKIGDASEMSCNFRALEDNFNSLVCFNIAILCYVEICEVAHSNLDL